MTGFLCFFYSLLSGSEVDSNVFETLGKNSYVINKDWTLVSLNFLSQPCDLYIFKKWMKLPSSMLRRLSFFMLNYWFFAADLVRRTWWRKVWIISCCVLGVLHSWSACIELPWSQYIAWFLRSQNFGSWMELKRNSRTSLGGERDEGNFA